MEFAEYQDKGNHRLMPLNSLGKMAMLYRDDQFQERLESFNIETEKEGKDGKKLVRATDLAVISDGYFSDDPLFFYAITSNLIAINNRTQKKS